MKPVLFISCAPAEQQDLPMLRKALAPIVSKFGMHLFDAYALCAGSEVEAEKERHIKRADVILTLVTNEYLGSSEGLNEWKFVSERKAQAARVIPIIWRAVSREALPPELSKVQTLPRSGIAVLSTGDVDKALADVVDEIAQLLSVQSSTGSNTDRPPASTMPALSAGQYMSIHRSALKAAAQLEKLGVQLSQGSATARATKVRQALQQRLYRVVVTGKSRAGKSTLLNALIGRVICPSQEELTTAVPIIIGPGERECAHIHYADDRKPLPLEGPLDAEKLQPYADQEKNPGNQEQVRQIVVTLGGSLLELGVVYMDIPGFDDPDPAIQSAAASAIETAHALIVVIDVSPRAHNGFTIDQATIKHLQAAQQRKCQLFIVGNKADVLTAAHRQAVEKDIQKRLAHAGSALQSKPIFLLSAADAVKSSGEDPDFRRFFDALWQDLWRTDGIGLHRLRQVFDELMRGSEEVAALFAALEAKEEERARLNAAVKRCAKQSQELQERCAVLHGESKKELAELIEQARHDLRQHIITTVRGLQPRQELPRPSEVLIQCKKQIERASRSVHDAIVTQATAHQQLIEAEVEARLMELRQQVGFSSNVTQMSQQLLAWRESVAGLDNYDPSREAVLAAGTASTLVGIALSAMSPLVGVVLAGALGVVTALIAKHLGDHATTPEMLIKQCCDHLDRELTENRKRISRNLGEFYNNLRELVDERMNPFINDMNKQLTMLRPPNAEERAMFDEFTRQSREALDLLRKLATGASTNRA